MKKVFSIFLALAMVLGMSAMAFAAPTISAEGDANSEVKLTAEAATFSVTVPTNLPVAVAADGSVTCADAATAKIVNASSGQVQVTAIAVNDAAPYTKVAFSDVATFKAYQADSHKYALKLGTNSTVAEDASVGLTAAGGLIGVAINGNNGELPIFYDVLSSAFKTAQSNVKIADVVFTVAWF